MQGINSLDNLTHCNQPTANQVKFRLAGVANISIELRKGRCLKLCLSGTVGEKLLRNKTKIQVHIPEKGITVSLIVGCRKIWKNIYCYVKDLSCDEIRLGNCYYVVCLKRFQVNIPSHKVQEGLGIPFIHFMNLKSMTLRKAVFIIIIYPFFSCKRKKEIKKSFF